MTAQTSKPDESSAPDIEQELLEHRDLQNAQVDSMQHVWDNPEDEHWNDPNIPGWEGNAAESNHERLAAATMDEYEHLTDSQWDLYDRMSAISEDSYCAGWISNCEYDIWQALQHGDPWPANCAMNLRLLRVCQKLSTEIDGWIYWADGPQFAPMAQWLAMVDARCKLVAAKK